MISLITGLPGSGKTSLMVYMLMTRSDLQNRPLFVDGISELKLPVMPIPDGQTMATWHHWVPTGAILVIDEAQRVFRPRSAGSKVPDYIQELETHRHKGIDIFVLTQHPRLIDVNLRSLVGEHRNISRTMLGFKRISYWQKCANPESRSDVAEAKNSIFFTKKAAFGMYKSADEHTKLNGRLSTWVWLLPLLVGIVVFLTFFVAGRFQSKLEPSVGQEQQANIESVAAGTFTLPQSSYSASQVAASESAQSLSELDFQPAIEGQPWTAPIYNELNHSVKTMPYPVACVQSKNSCHCYTEQASLIDNMDEKLCRKFVKNGIYNPYRNQDEILPVVNNHNK